MECKFVYDNELALSSDIKDVSIFYLQGAATGPMTSISTETIEAPMHSAATKVSSISKTNENKGVNINRSHEVPGKSSTDGTASDASKSGGLSLDALAKAKRALQMQKELAERMKKIPSVSSLVVLFHTYYIKIPFLACVLCATFLRMLFVLLLGCYD